MKSKILRKIIFVIIGTLFCSASLFLTEFAIGSIYTTNCSEAKKVSYAIDAIALSNNATFVDYEFKFENPSGKRLNSRAFFKEEYGIETESVMLVTSKYSHSRIEASDIQAACDGKNFKIDSISSMTNLTFCFDFKCVLTKTTLPKSRVGISESLAKRILNKTSDDDLTKDEILNLSKKILTISINGSILECSVYCYYTKSSNQSYFNRYLNGDFVVFHETEISPSNYNYVLTAVSYNVQVQKILNKLKYPNTDLTISLTDDSCVHKNIDLIITDYINRIKIEKPVLYISLVMFAGFGFFSGFYFLKLKNRYLLFIGSLLLTDLIMLWIFKLVTEPFIVISLSNYFCYISVVLFAILFIKKKYKYE